MSRWQGVFPIVLTTFNEDGSLDLKSQLELVDFLISEGAHGLALFGNASEGYALSGSERLELMKQIIPHVRKRVPVIVSSGHTGTDCAVALSREAQQLGADGLMVLPPHFLKPDGAGVFYYYSQISNAVSIPIMVQDAPLLTQVAIPASLLAKLSKETANVRYAKVESPPTTAKVTEAVAAVDKSFTVFGGLNGHFFLEELRRGSRGTMPGSDMVKQFVRIWDHFEANEMEGAHENFNRILPLIRYELQPGLGVSVMKHNLFDAGVIGSTRVRHPTRTLDGAGIEELKDIQQAIKKGAGRTLAQQAQ